MKKVLMIGLVLVLAVSAITFSRDALIDFGKGQRCYGGATGVRQRMKQGWASGWDCLASIVLAPAALLTEDFGWGDVADAMAFDGPTQNTIASVEEPETPDGATTVPDGYNPVAY